MLGKNWADDPILGNPSKESSKPWKRQGCIAELHSAPLPKRAEYNSAILKKKAAPKDSFQAVDKVPFKSNPLKANHSTAVKLAKLIPVE
jgi:hypothetical protein